MKIVVLCGGLSHERDVSLSSGAGVAKALRQRGHQVVLLDLFLGYNGLAGSADEVFAQAEEIRLERVTEQAPDLDRVRKLREDSACIIGPQVLDICRAADITFLALHGEEGENGKLQAAFDLHGIRYTGCGYLGSALAMNKGLSKALFRENGIPVPGGVIFEKGKLYPEHPGYPCVVKPCSGGSSVGTSIVQTAEEFDRALEWAFSYEKQVLVEKFIKARELTVGVMDGKAMPVIEIIPKSGFYDYKNKYQAGATIELCPAPIGEAATVKVQRLAARVNAALMIDAYCRVDFLWDEQTDEMYCLEANTLPGMTPTSLIPQMGEALGYNYGELCEKIIEVSMRKYTV